MRLNTCTGCGRPFKRKYARHRLCDACAPAGRDDRSPTTRAQDAEYDRERARVLAPGPDGRPPRCYYCPAPATTVDHVRAVARGGRHRGNLVPCCEPCNARKQHRPAAVLRGA